MFNAIKFGIGIGIGLVSGFDGVVISERINA
jgi:hypothetical protein